MNDNITQRFELDASQYLAEVEKVAKKNRQLGGSLDDLGSSFKSSVNNDSEKTLRKVSKSTDAATLSTSKFSRVAQQAGNILTGSANSATILSTALTGGLVGGAVLGGVALLASGLQDVDAEFDSLIDKIDNLRDLQTLQLDRETRTELAALKSEGRELDTNVQLRREELSLIRSSAAEAERAAVSAQKRLQSALTSADDRAFAASLSGERLFDQARSLFQRAAQLQRLGQFDRASDAVTQGAGIAQQLGDANLLRSAQTQLSSIESKRLSTLRQQAEQTQKQAVLLRGQEANAEQALRDEQARQELNRASQERVSTTSKVVEAEREVVEQVVKANLQVERQIGLFERVGSVIKSSFSVNQSELRQQKRVFEGIESGVNDIISSAQRGEQIDLRLLTSLSTRLESFDDINIARFEPFIKNTREAINSLKSAFEAQTDFISNSTDAAAALSRQESAAKGIADNLVRGAAAQQIIAGSQFNAQAQALGGSIRGFQSGGFARGTDTVPAMLTPGEFVVNAQSSRKFFSQLQAINAGIQPVFREQGGNVTIGDINMTVNTTKDDPLTSPKAGQQIMRQIERQIRLRQIGFRTRN